jgi:hypothetical protein
VFSLTCVGDRPLASIATRDVAATAARLLTGRSWTGQENVPVFGPDRLTPEGMAEVIGEELGRPIGYRRITLADFAAMRRAHGASDRTVADAVEMLAAQDEGVYDADWATAAIAETDFRTWCREVTSPAQSPSLTVVAISSGRPPGRMLAVRRDGGLMSSARSSGPVQWQRLCLRPRGSGRLGEEGVDVGGEQARFLVGGEMSAAGHGGVARDVVGPLDPAAR